MSLALEQPRLTPVQPWGCPRARDTFGSLRPSPEKTTCSFPYRPSGKSRNSGLVPGERDPNGILECIEDLNTIYDRKFHNAKQIRGKN